TPEILNLKDDEIEIIVDKKKKTIEIIDTGIGLTQEELVETLGTIAQSGTANFLKENDNENDQKNLEQTLIGQFGVGFYSAFMVSKIVEVTSRKAGTKNSSVWESDGQSGYSITEAENEHPVGTSIKLFLKKDAKNYCESAQIEALIKKYSDHIQVPVKIKETDGESQQVNSATALWTKQSQDISKEEYKDFYNSNFATFDDPFLTLHNKSEGTLEFTNLLFVPTQAPFDLFEPERKTNISLYINRVFITDEIQDVIPTWLRFVKGILDTSSLDLNVSREMVQNSPVLKKISKAITKRVISGLKKKLTKEEEAYDAFWGNFGKVIKEGLYEDFENRNKIAEIIKVYSFKEDKLITLKAYLENFTEGQDQIFYLTADTLSQAQSSPHLEGFKSKGIDVLLMTDPIDAFWISQIQNFQEKPFISISRDKYDISKTGTDSSIPNDTNKENEEIYTKLIKECLGDLIQDVTISSNLVDSPVRLIAGEGGLDFNLERILKAQGQGFEGSKKVIEINTNHELIKKLPSLTEDLQKATCRVIFEQARIQDGEMPTNTRQFSQDLIKLVLEV
ncbi:molecular chaperone HtpG, partial [Amylibacter sp.]|nr:molecular chaperone HtpG [Amylibacter sp.]